MTTSVLDCIDKLPDGAFLFRSIGAKYACGWTYGDVLRAALMYDTPEAARMAWEMSDKAAAYRSALRGAGFHRVIVDEIKEMWGEVYS